MLCADLAVRREKGASPRHLEAHKATLRELALNGHATVEHSVVELLAVLTIQGASRAWLQRRRARDAVGRAMMYSRADEMSILSGGAWTEAADGEAIGEGDEGGGEEGSARASTGSAGGSVRSAAGDGSVRSTRSGRSSTSSHHHHHHHPSLSPPPPPPPHHHQPLPALPPTSGAPLLAFGAAGGTSLNAGRLERIDSGKEGDESEEGASMRSCGSALSLVSQGGAGHAELGDGEQPAAASSSPSPSGRRRAGVGAPHAPSPLRSSNTSPSAERARLASYRSSGRTITDGAAAAAGRRLGPPPHFSDSSTSLEEGVCLREIPPMNDL